LRSGRKGILVTTILVAVFGSAIFTTVDVPVESTEIARPDPGIVPLIATATGTVRRIHVREGGLVSQGDTILQLESRDLVAKRKKLEAKIHLREISKVAGNELSNLYRQLENCQLELNSRTLVSPVDGQVIWLASLRPGDILRPGTAIATIVARTKDLETARQIQ
jgi:multidrug resistance efflux pump